MVRKFCHGILIAAFAWALGASAGAQETAAEGKGTPAPAAAEQGQGAPAPAAEGQGASPPAPAAEAPSQAAPAPAAEAPSQAAPAPATAEGKPSPEPTAEGQHKEIPASASGATSAPQTGTGSAEKREPIGAPSRAKEDKETIRIRGVIASLDSGSMVIRTSDRKALRIRLLPNTTVFKLSRGSFADVTFGTYVGSVSVQLGDDIYSPIRRDSLSWLHEGFELRILDEQLRGLAVGFVKWDLTKESVMTHGWVDDMEDRVLSIKYGPTEEEETDVEVRRNVPVQKMSLGDRSLLRAGVQVFAGTKKTPDGGYVAGFVMVGQGGAIPAL